MWSWLGDFNEGDMLFLGGWGPWVIGGLAAVALLVLVLSWLDLREMRPRRRAWMLIGLRAFVLGLGLFFLLEPTLELRDVERLRNHVVVMLDGSRSMEVEVADGTTRLERGAEAVREFRETYGTTSEKHLYEYALFGEELERASAGALSDGESYAQSSNGTRIRKALEAVKAEFGRNELGGVVILSDGIDSGVLGGRNPRGESLDSETLRFLKSLDAPVHVLAVSPESSFQDVSVAQVLHDEFAFVRNRIAIDVKVRALGYGGTGAQVELWQDGEMKRSRAVSFAEDSAEETVTFEIVPEQLGKAVFTVRVPELDGEALAENNEYHFIMKVIRDKIRVLQVAGQPSWDERFVRRLLKENPNVDLISFFILRTNSNLNLAAQNEMSLIPFPKDELFDKELRSFDLVIFQNFNFGPYVRPVYLDRVEEFVREGGGFAMVGGALSFTNGGYSGTPIGGLLPVELYPGSAGDGSDLLSEEPFRMDLAAAALRHPIMKLAFDPRENRRSWESLPALEGTNRVKRLHPTATLLGTHPDLKDADGNPMPVLSVRDYGKGRVMAFTTDSGWLWGFDAVGQGSTSRGFTNFWNNAIRWLIKDPELKLIKVETEQDALRPGETVRVTVRVLQPDYSPAAGAKGVVRVVRRDLEPPYGVEEGEEIAFETDERGVFTFERPVDVAGAYTVLGEVKRDDVELEDDDVFLVTSSTPEHRDVVPRNALLEQIAVATGGLYLELPQADLTGLYFGEPKVARVNKRSLYALWDAWWMFALLIGALVMEWLLRRRWGRL